MAGEEKVEKSNILMYTTEDGVTKVEVTFDNDTVWLSLDQIADLFQRNKSTISRHIKNSNLDSKANADTVSGLSADLNNVKESINPLKTSLVGDINNNTVGVVNIVAWDSNTTSTPKSTGNTIYGDGFCLTYSTGNQWLCQLAMAVGDSHLFTRYRRDSVWSGWETK